jgi:uncharacterized protein (UPF0262 family)
MIPHPHPALAEIHIDSVRIGSITPAAAVMAEISALAQQLNDLTSIGNPSDESITSGSYALQLSVDVKYVTLELGDANGTVQRIGAIETTSLRALARSYIKMIQDMGSGHLPKGSLATERLTLLDAGRRSLHNEGAEMLQSLLTGSFALNFAGARLIFAIISHLLAEV